MSLEDAARQAREHADTCIERGWNVGVRAIEFGRLFLENRRHRVGGRVALEGALAAERDAARQCQPPADITGIPTAAECGYRPNILIPLVEPTPQNPDPPKPGSPEWWTG